MSTPLVVSFGGGVNSAAMLVGMHERGIKPDLILFADTGGEKPETYAFVEQMRTWVVKNMDLGIVTVGHPKGDTLRESCFRNGTLPSKAYGYPGCSVKFKHQLMEGYETKAYGSEAIITKAIGYHAGEDRGSGIVEKGRYRYHYFLKEWGWFQRDCISAIERADLPVPIKSACYYCPSSKPHEILWLAKNHPDLYADAIAMEDNAEEYHRQGGGYMKGLGRHWSWRQVVKADADQFKMFIEPDPVPCMCFDGESEATA